MVVSRWAHGPVGVSTLVGTMGKKESFYLASKQIGYEAGALGVHPVVMMGELV